MDFNKWSIYTSLQLMPNSITFVYLLIYGKIGWVEISIAQLCYWKGEFKFSIIIKSDKQQWLIECSDPLPKMENPTKTTPILPRPTPSAQTRILRNSKNPTFLKITFWKAGWSFCPSLISFNTVSPNKRTLNFSTRNRAAGKVRTQPSRLSWLQLGSDVYILTNLLNKTKRERGRQPSGHLCSFR